MKSPEQTLRMVLADGSALMRAGIKRMLANAPEIEIVEEHTDAVSTIAAIRDSHPDLVMLDFHLGSGSAIEVLRECKLMKPRPLCIVHTERAQPGIRAISYAAGADVFYDDGRDITPLLELLRKVASAILDPVPIPALVRSAA